MSSLERFIKKGGYEASLSSQAHHALEATSARQKAAELQDVRFSPRRFVLNRVAGYHEVRGKTAEKKIAKVESVTKSPQVIKFYDLVIKNAEKMGNDHLAQKMTQLKNGGISQSLPQNKNTRNIPVETILRDMALFIGNESARKKTIQLATGSAAAVEHQWRFFLERDSYFAESGQSYVDTEIAKRAVVEMYKLLGLNRFISYIPDFSAGGSGSVKEPIFWIPDLRMQVEFKLRRPRLLSTPDPTDMMYRGAEAKMVLKKEDEVWKKHPISNLINQKEALPQD